MEKQDNFDRLPPLPTRDEYVNSYIDTLSRRDVNVARDIANQIFMIEQPLADCQVLIPVAAHQEAPQIENAIIQYAQQKTDEPFSVILSLNSPTSQKENPEIIATLDAVEQAKKFHPELDLRTAFTFYDRPTIGMIRRDLWNGALLASTYSSAYDTPHSNEIIGINHDIDVSHIGTHYIQRVQNHYQKKRNIYDKNGLQSTPLPPGSTQLKHAYSPEHPNISKGAFWMDYSTRAANGTYEAGLTIPLSHYAQVGGFLTTATTHETEPLQRARPTRHSVPGASLETSPRRYIDRLQYGFDSIWTTESFGDSDNCRTATDQPDLTQEQLETIFLKDDYLKGTLRQLIINAMDTYLIKNPPKLPKEVKGDADGNLSEEAMRKLKKVIVDLNTVGYDRLEHDIKILNRALGSEKLTNYALNLYLERSLVSEVIFNNFIILDDPK